MIIIVSLGIIATLAVVLSILYIRSDEFQMRKAYLERINNHPKAGQPKRK
jgi:hypothetical protein